jgi:hypothetical protein
MTPKVVPATQEHVRRMAPNLRECDVEEIYLVSCSGPDVALELALHTSPRPYVGLHEGEPFCMFGAGAPDYLSVVGAPWMLATDTLDLYAYQLGKQCRKYVREMFEDFDYLENYVYAGNLKAVNWLRWIGFTLHPPQPYGCFKKPFYRFTMEASECATPH